MGPNEQYRGGRGQSYRPGGPRDRSPPPRGDSYRARSPPRRADGGRADTYRGPRHGRSPPPRRDAYPRRSPSPGPRFRDRDPRGPDSYRARPRSPARRDDLPRDDLFRREAARDFQGDGGYRNGGDIGRNERDQDYGPARSPPRFRDRSPIPPKRGRELSPVGSRGRRSPPPLKRDRLASPQERGWFDDRPSSRAQSPPGRRERDGPRDFRPRSRSPLPRADRPDTRLQDDRRRPLSPASQQSASQGLPVEETSAKSSAATSRRSSPPVHPSRLALQNNQSYGREVPPPERTEITEPRARSPDRERQGLPPRNGTAAVPLSAGSGDSGEPMLHADRINNIPLASRPPPLGPAGQRAPSLSTGQPTGPSTVTNASALSSPRMSANPPAGPRGPSGSGRPDLDSPRGRGGFRGDFGSRGGIAGSVRGGRGGPSGFARGPSGPSHDREPEMASSPPSGPRGPASQAPPPPFRQNSTSIGASSRSQRFGPGGQPIPDQSAPTGPRGFRRPTDATGPADISSRPIGPHPALTDLPKRKEGGEKAAPLIDRSRLDRLEDDAEKLRRAIDEREVRQRRYLREWDRLSRDSAAAAFRTELAEESLRKWTGASQGAAAF